MRFYYLGQLSMANRGCEALIRSNTKLLLEKYPESEFFCPSENGELDLRQWPDLDTQNVKLVRQPKFPVALKIWGRIFRTFPAFRKIGVLPFSLDAETRNLIKGVDCVLMTGGDIISLDYGLNPLYYWSGLVDAAHRLGKPTHLLAASVGPFSKDPLTERHMVAHLARYSEITVRETASFDYLQSLGLSNVRQVVDPAFVLDPEPLDVSSFIDDQRSYLGFNVSPLVRKIRTDEKSRREFDEGIKGFLRRVIFNTKKNIVLVPHVDPLKGEWDNSDRAYMMRILSELGDTGNRVSITPDFLNAAQIKYVLGKCHCFIGARTHATIGAISQGVPTLSIAYSVKAVGINKDLFGSTDYVLPTPEVSEETLWSGFTKLETRREHIKSLLSKKIPEWKNRTREIVKVI